MENDESDPTGEINSIPTNNSTRIILLPEFVPWRRNPPGSGRVRESQTLVGGSAGAGR